MTDRELLELAAKAVGVELQPMEVKNVSHIGDDRFIGYMVSADKWPRGWFNPLTDDGDALRLAIDARINIEFAFCEDDAPIVIAGDRYNQVQECLAPDFKAKTRRAIVRAAAEIWKAMK